jgi:hypothetical protein
MVYFDLAGELQRCQLSPDLGVKEVAMFSRPLVQLGLIADVAEAILDQRLKFPRHAVW